METTNYTDELIGVCDVYTVIVDSTGDCCADEIQGYSTYLTVTSQSENNDMVGEAAVTPDGLILSDNLGYVLRVEPELIAWLTWNARA